MTDSLDFLDGFDLDQWVGRFDVLFIEPAVMEIDRAVALHRLTKYGPELGIGEWEIWIADDCRPYQEYLVLHEAVENYLRRKGWDYDSSHEAAVVAERAFFGHLPKWQRYMKDV